MAHPLFVSLFHIFLRINSDVSVETHKASIAS